MLFPGITLARSAKNRNYDKVASILLNKRKIAPEKVIDVGSWSATYDDKKLLSIIMENVNPSIKDTIVKSTLVFAVVKGSKSIVKEILDDKYYSSLVNDLNLPGIEGNSLLFIATLFSHEDVVNFLLSMNADPNSGKFSPLAQARKNNGSRIVSSLKKKGAKQGKHLIDVSAELAVSKWGI